MKFAVLLSGSGVYDGSEIQEAIFTLLALEQEGMDYQCFAPDKKQYHVVNHLTGEEMNETRNCLVESARIARGNIKDFAEYQESSFDGLVIVGGFGAAKNINQWALQGKDGAMDQIVQSKIIKTLDKKKQILAMCMGPTVVAKALEGSKYQAKLSVGHAQESSPYEIEAIHEGMKSIGAKTVNKSKTEIAIDQELNIISVPAYMMEANMVEVYQNILQGVKALK